ncbi:MAG: Uracil phosphoribosyltransferase [Candidatus Roizmanbacteria bacterium GW2011_GWA2_37_7]|uniref:uracil phosphoribosyltransferase n=1 Tax=Candidatus Roizmanbacteria bacterium GW2011_GWA2_37_7 TaxID=1618481 RepID=A0A0G0KA61_9BACT|nr:MAG: Uracil phosphoribosyltransferase [Candidatus Roizmanbacteria bacterium GW2011_GWA2_37_7]
MLHIHVSSHPLIQHKLSLLRDVKTDPKLFREIVGEIAALLAYEATENLFLKEVKIQTPLTTAMCKQVKEKIGLVPILRAGLGMVEGIWKLMPQAEVWHIGLYRDEKTFQPIEYYNKLPISPTVDIVLVVDPMLATGGSATATIDILKKWGATRIKFIGLIAAPEGITEVHNHYPEVPIQ